MAMVIRNETIQMPDGGEMGAFVALPEAGHGPGLVVLMEIFGVGSYIRRATERLAELGYVALAPDLYRRTDPGLELEHDQAGLRAAGGPVGVLGFCLGGSLAFAVAAEGDPAVAVSYYGSTVADALGDRDRISCAVQFHFGAEDPYIPVSQAELVAAAAARRPAWERHIPPERG